AAARAVGIERSTGAAAPQDKLACVRALQAEGRIVAMLGDGVNDTPVLAGADVSVAMGAGADAAQRRADIVLLGSSLLSLLEAMRVSRRAMQLVRQNIAWAMAYNAVALPLAALGWMGPWQAALGMGASSVLVLANALRPLSRKTKTWKASTSSFPSPSPSFS
ncbi:MAG: HAD-IC family P-type ATPase, partial [Betaproteobacteria bacterium]|nr:HAD-IC family P-type ATPase [Betaproteobacteria bacterium]